MYLFVKKKKSKYINIISQETSSEMAVGVTEKKNRQFFMVGTKIDHRNDIKS